jgi:hypothetical protein
LVYAQLHPGIIRISIKKSIFNREVAMLRKPLIAVVLLLGLVTMACGVTFNLPVTQVKTGQTQTDTINVPLLQNSSAIANINLGFGAGDFSLAPGAENALISGTVTYNVADFKPKVTIDGNNIRVEQGNLNIQGIPSFNESVKNQWNLLIANTPVNLKITAGAYNGDYELGGLSLQDLEISDGASNVNLNFSKPNLIPMDTFLYQTGASSIKMLGLANANFNNMTFRCGAGSYQLDFSGQLKRDMNITIESGISNIVLIIPQGVSARVTFEGGLSSVNTSGNWTKNGNTYIQTASGPTIRVDVKMGAGNLDLHNN